MTTPTDDEMDLLIAYALDTLEPEETERARLLVADRPELGATLAELRATLGTLPQALPEPALPPELRGRVLDRALGRSRPAPAPIPERAASAARRWLLGLSGLATALAVAVVLLLGQVAATQSQLSATQSELADVRGDLDRAIAERQQFAEVVARASSVAELSGDTGRGAVLRTPEGQIVFAAQLPPLAAGRVYQLWLIGADGAPASGGTFTVDERGFGQVAVAAGPEALAAGTFAVTDEPGPAGSSGPTSTPLIAGTTAET
jgi:anti-sigma-K factor RskA